MKTYMAQKLGVIVILTVLLAGALAQGIAKADDGEIVGHTHVCYQQITDDDFCF